MSRDLDRIRKLLAVALDNRTNEHEADAAKQLAERLAAIAGVTLDEVLRETQAGEVDVISTVAAYTGAHATEDWQLVVSAAVARVLGCKCYRTWVTFDGVKSIVWIGTVDQRYAADEIYKWVCHEIESRSKSAQKQNKGKRGWKHAYMRGMADAIAQQARRITEDVEMTNPVGGTALLRRDRLEQAIDNLMPEGLRSARRMKGVRGDGFAAGRLDGSTVSLRRTVPGAGIKRLGS